MTVKSELLRGKALRALIISADQFEDSELLQPLKQLKAKDVVVDVASPEGVYITGKHGSQVKVDLLVKEAVSDNYDLLILPGGKAPARLRHEPNVVELVRQMLLQNKPIAAICHGPLVLIATGLLAGRTSTGYHTIMDELQAAGARYKNLEVVVDGNLITSRQPHDLPAFLREIFNMLRLTD